MCCVLPSWPQHPLPGKWEPLTVKNRKRVTIIKTSFMILGPVLSRGTFLWPHLQLLYSRVFAQSQWLGYFPNSSPPPWLYLGYRPPLFFIWVTATASGLRMSPSFSPQAGLPTLTFPHSHHPFKTQSAGVPPLPKTLLESHCPFQAKGLVTAWEPFPFNLISSYCPANSHRSSHTARQLLPQDLCTRCSHCLEHSAKFLHALLSHL